MSEEKFPGADNPTERHSTNRPNRSRVKLSVPWLAPSQSVDGVTPAVIKGFVVERSRVHEVFIREQAKNKRIGLSLAFALIVLAAVIVMFAPEGRQTLSYWIGAALLIFAAGASGFGRVWGKTKSISFGADQDRPGPGE